MDSVATRAGTRVHTALECFYGDLVSREVPAIELLLGNWQDYFREREMLDVFWEELNALAGHQADLLRRASAGYTGPGPIRTAGGGISQAPERTKQWKDLAARFRMDERRQDLDSLADLMLCDGWDQVSLVDTFLASVSYLLNYKDTLPLLRVEHIEAELLPHNVSLPGVDGMVVNGFIDLLARDVRGKLYLIDHKTTKAEPSESKLMHMDQLCLYAYACKQIFGEYPAFVGINHLRSNRLVLAPFDERLMHLALGRLTATIGGIRSKVFIPQSPTSYNTPCYSDYTGACPYLGHCHPGFARAVGDTRWD
jgi:hypothetical protein